MQTQSQKIINSLNDIIVLLDSTREESACFYSDIFKNYLKILNGPHEPNEMAKNILKMFGGMGTFNDLVLYRDGILLRKENDLLDELTTQLFDACMGIVPGYRPFG